MISVVIPLYNKEQSILSTLQSVLNQTYQNFEIVVVNDGSTDNGASLVETIGDSRIHLIDKPNGGVSSARNLGITNAQSEHIAFLDADDLWETSYLAEIARMISDFPQAAIWGTSYWFLKDNEKISANKPLPKGFYGIIDNSQWDLAHIYCTTSVCCRKSVMQTLGLFDERIQYGEDVDIWWRIMLEHPAVYSNTELAIYRFDEANRLMNYVIPLKKLYICYFEKYAHYRKQNSAFRHFIDKECMWWLYPYYVRDRNNSDVKRILKEINLSEYKWTFKLRFRAPLLYHLYLALKKTF